MTDRLHVLYFYAVEKKWTKIELWLNIEIRLTGLKRRSESETEWEKSEETWLRKTHLRHRPTCALPPTYACNSRPQEVSTEAGRRVRQWTGNNWDLFSIIRDSDPQGSEPPGSRLWPHNLPSLKGTLSLIPSLLLNYTDVLSLLHSHKNSVLKFSSKCWVNKCMYDQVYGGNWLGNREGTKTGRGVWRQSFGECLSIQWW